MDDKVVYEFRVIKTADGFRVEMKGDKEQMHGFGPHMHPFGRHSDRSWSHWGRHWRRAWQSWCDESDSEEEKPSATGGAASQSL